MLARIAEIRTPRLKGRSRPEERGTRGVARSALASPGAGPTARGVPAGRRCRGRERSRSELKNRHYVLNRHSLEHTAVRVLKLAAMYPSSRTPKQNAASMAAFLVGCLPPKKPPQRPSQSAE
jgi:hypothetical protein